MKLTQKWGSSPGPAHLLDCQQQRRPAHHFAVHGAWGIASASKFLLVQLVFPEWTVGHLPQSLAAYLGNRYCQKGRRESLTHVQQIGSCGLAD
jgi:hypothetical protein